jgi:Tfp pilus assembly protein PilF
MLRAVAANPGSVRLHNWLARVYLEIRRYPEALKELDAALALDPESEVTLENLAGLYKMLGRHEEAVQTYRRALAGNPGSSKLRFKLGVAELARGRLEASRAALEMARGAGPAWVELHNILAEVYLALEMHDEATAELRASLRLDPQQEGVRKALTRLQVQGQT